MSIGNALGEVALALGRLVGDWAAYAFVVVATGVLVGGTFWAFWRLLRVFKRSSV